MKIAEGSSSWILVAFIAGLIFLFLTLIFNLPDVRFISLFVAIVMFSKTVVFIIFFRDPDRDIGSDIVASADGKIREIVNLKDADVGNCTRISTFMTLYNVHVNRLPLDGVVKSISHISGVHLPAFKKESEKNERVITIVDTKIGTIKIIQIAGTIARRIVPYIKKGDKLKKGDKIGIIRFGSRVDIYLPSKEIKNISVKIGDMVKAGETSIGKIND